MRQDCLDSNNSTSAPLLAHRRNAAGVESPNVWAFETNDAALAEQQGVLKAVDKHGHRMVPIGIVEITEREAPAPVAEEMRMALQDLLRKAELDQDVDFLREGMRGAAVDGARGASTSERRSTNGLPTEVASVTDTEIGAGTHVLAASSCVISVTTNSAIVVQTATNTARDAVYVGRAPHEGFVTPDGRELWVAVRGQNWVSVIDLQQNQEVARIPTAAGPAMVVFSPDGQRAFVNHDRAPELHVVNVTNKQVIKRITGLDPGFSPNLQITPDGKRRSG